LRLIYRVHALRRVFVRSITPAEVRTVIEQGQTIERHPNDTRIPAALLGFVGGRALHVVVANTRMMTRRSS
jgi:hypothetical protein